MNKYKFFKILTNCMLILNPLIGMLMVGAVVYFGLKGFWFLPVAFALVHLNMKFFAWAHRVEIEERRVWIEQETDGYSLIGYDAYVGIAYFKHDETGENKTIVSDELYDDILKSFD